MLTSHLMLELACFNSSAMALAKPGLISTSDNSVTRHDLSIENAVVLPTLPVPIIPMRTCHFLKTRPELVVMTWRNKLIILMSL